MSDIKVGDLVMVVRKHGCGCDLGDVFVVRELERSPSGYLDCSVCGARAFSSLDASSDHGWRAVAALKRIPPLSELEGEKRDEEITA